MASKLIDWSPGRVRLVLEGPEDAPVRLAALHGTADGPDADPPVRRQPLVEVLVLGEGRTLSNTRYSDTAVGARLRYAGSVERADGPWRELRVRQRDAMTGLEAVSVFRGRAGVSAVQSWTEVGNHGTEPRILQMVSSFASGALLEAGEDPADLALMRARADWCAEGRWATVPLRGRDGLADINSELHDHDGRG